MEEDIKILEGLVNGIYKYGFDYDVDGEKHDIIRYEEFKALENLLTRYKQQKERIRCLELKIANQKDQIKLLRNHRLRKYVMSEYIEKSKVKEKIEEYKKLIKEVQDNEEHYHEIPLYEHDIEVLQELLREE